MSAAKKHHHSSYEELPRAAVIATLIGIGLSMLMAALDQTVVGTAMPRIIADLKGFEHYSGVVTAYMIASTMIVPVSGKLSDFYGRKLFLLIGVSFFIFSSLLCGAAQSMTQLIIFRGLQGLGAGITQAMAFTTIADLFPPAQRGKASGVMGSVFGLASVVGPAVGGYLTDGPGWRYVFYVNIPVGLLALFVLIFYFPHVRSARHGTKPKFDFAGLYTFVLSVVPLLLALSWGGRDYAWNSPIIIGLLCVSAFLTPIFINIERKAPEPIFPVLLFKNRIAWTSFTAASLVSMGMFGAVLFIPLFIQTVLGSSATKSGAIMMPMTLALIAASVSSGQVITRMGKYRSIAIAGVSIATMSTFLLSRMTETTSYLVVLRNVILMGTGLGLTLPVFTLSVQNAFDFRLVGSVTAMVQFMRSIGGSIGVAVFGSILANRYIPIFHETMPQDILQSVPDSIRSQLDNPRALMRPDAEKHIQSILQTTFGDHTDAVLVSIRSAMKTALSVSLQEVFTLAAVLLGISVVITLFLKDIPLRKSNRPGGPNPGPSH